MKSKLLKAPLLFFTFFFLIESISHIKNRFSNENATERQGQVVGIIRLYCLEEGGLIKPSWPENSKNSNTIAHFSPFLSPQLPFGHIPFNMEFSVFEWLTGKTLSHLTKKNCNYVEETGRMLSIFFSLLCILGVFLYLKIFTSQTIAIIFSVLLFSHWSWLRFSNYIIFDIRMIAFSLLGYYFAFIAQKNKKFIFLSALFFALSSTFKPQGFLFVITFILLQHLIYFKNSNPFNSKNFTLFISLSLAFIFALIYFSLSNNLNNQNDLPWLAWNSTKHLKWFLGDLKDRTEISFYKSLFLEIIKKSGLLFIFLSFTVLYYLKLTNQNLSFKLQLLKFLKACTPFFIAHIVYKFIFIKMIKIHDYYILPVDVFSVVSFGLIFHAFEDCIKEKYKIFLFKISSLLISVFCIFNFIKWHTYLENHNNPKSSIYNPDYGLKIFPKENAFVVFINSSRGRDYSNHVLTKTTGYGWCLSNLKFAPRKFWKEQGIEYVAQFDGVDPNTHQSKFIIRTIEEEILLAQKNGWSSDRLDVWGELPMHEWARLATIYNLDPCENGEVQKDPRNWKKLIENSKILNKQ